MLKYGPYVAGICERGFLLRILPEEALGVGGQRKRFLIWKKHEFSKNISLVKKRR